MHFQRQIIHKEPLAPAKPALEEPCNGCGVCCLAEPCPLGMVLSRKRTGACDALVWVASAATYRCGAVTEPKEVLQRALPAVLRTLRDPLSPALTRLAVRWIAAGTGCDCKLESHD